MWTFGVVTWFIISGDVLHEDHALLGKLIYKLKPKHLNQNYVSVVKWLLKFVYFHKFDIVVFVKTTVRYKIVRNHDALFTSLPAKNLVATLPPVSR